MKTLLTLVFALGASFAQAEGTWETVDMPDGNGETICGMYGDTIVGYYHNYHDGFNYGFIRNGTNWITGIQMAFDTYANGVYGSNVVCDYSAMDFEQGALLNYTDLAHMTAIVAPGAQQTRACGIWGDTVVGGADGHGFIYNITTKTWTNINMPGATGTSAEGICGNKVVGCYSDAIGRYHGFLYNGTSWTSIDVPGANSTYAEGAYGNNIVGIYQDANWKAHAFLYNGTSFTTVDPPGASEASAYGIYGNKVVGVYVDSSGYGHGLIYTILGPELKLSSHSSTSTVAFAATPGDVYNIQASTDLVTWATVTTVVVNASSNVIYNEVTSAPRMFYRASY